MALFEQMLAERERSGGLTAPLRAEERPTTPVDHGANQDAEEAGPEIRVRNLRRT